jgi:hypothetical protein
MTFRASGKAAAPHCDPARVSPGNRHKGLTQKSGSVRSCSLNRNFPSGARPCGGTGRRTRFKIALRKEWRLDSLHGHQSRLIAYFSSSILLKTFRTFS